MSQAVIAIGANLGDRMDTIEKAVRAVSLLPGTKVEKYSNIYETDPVGYADQPKFFKLCNRD